MKWLEKLTLFWHVLSVDLKSLKVLKKEKLSGFLKFQTITKAKL